MADRRMRGIIYQGPGKLEVADVPVPVPGPGEIVVKVGAALTCGTDLKTYLRGHPIQKPPMLWGHEFSGDVSAVGAGVKAFEPGMRVVAHNSAPCGACYWCRHEQQSLCPDIVYNYGAYAQYVRVPAPIVTLNTYRLPDHVSYAEAAAVEPLSTVVHGQRILGIQPGERVAIFGAGGPIGLMHLQMARSRGASQIIAIDTKPARLEVARQLGATALVNPAETDPVAAVRELTDGIGADATIEAAGQLVTWQGAAKAVRKGGRVLWFGGLPGGTQVEVDSFDVHYGEVSFFGTYHCTPIDVYTAFSLISAGVVNTKVLVTREAPLEGVEEALLSMRDGTAVKVAIIPNAA